MLTQSCSAAPGVANQVFGPNRDCEFVAGTMMNQCTPGATVKLLCEIDAKAMPQVVRFCESSVKLQTGTACRIMDRPDFGLANSTLANVVVLPGTATKVTFTCPVARDEIETGGWYSQYHGAVYNGVDGVEAVRCS